MQLWQVQLQHVPQSTKKSVQAVFTVIRTLSGPILRCDNNLSWCLQSPSKSRLIFSRRNYIRYLMVLFSKSPPLSTNGISRKDSQLYGKHQLYNFCANSRHPNCITGCMCSFLGRLYGERHRHMFYPSRVDGSWDSLLRLFTKARKSHTTARWDMKDLLFSAVFLSSSAQIMRPSVIIIRQVVLWPVQYERAIRGDVLDDCMTAWPGSVHRVHSLAFSNACPRIQHTSLPTYPSKRLRRAPF